MERIDNSKKVRLQTLSEEMGEVAKSKFIHETYFLYDVDNIVKNAYIKELNKSLLIYRIIMIIDKTNNNKELDLVMLQKEIMFDIQKDFYGGKF